MDQLTGQILTRPSGSFAPDGRKLVMLVGVVAVDKDSPLTKEGMQFIVAGPSDFHDVTRLLPINVLQDGQTDRSKLADGEELGHMLLEPIWRV